MGWESRDLSAELDPQEEHCYSCVRVEALYDGELSSGVDVYLSGVSSR